MRHLSSASRRREKRNVFGRRITEEPLHQVGLAAQIGQYLIDVGASFSERRDTAVEIDALGTGVIGGKSQGEVVAITIE